ncbi:MAG TPA: hypothetical protein P5260_15825 [Candidatus Competibacter sp.]|nr:hypothetical protein [Candidatus Competibacter sp.]HRX62664.1 hypothetical protein [Candidatus Competibacter sp.]
MLEEKNLKLAGWLSIVSAVLALPMLVLGFISGMVEDKSAAILYLEALFSTTHAVMYAYVFLTLKRVLNQKANFYEVDKYIIFMIWITIVITAISVITLPFKGVQEMIGVGALILLIPFGVIYVVFGIKLLNCKDNLFGYLKPFSYLAIATGMMTAVVILVLLGMLTDIISYVILAIIFFKSATLVQVQGALESEQT